MSKFCTDAGFLATVDVGQYFMTKDTEEFSRFTDSVACHEYTLPRNESSSEPQSWIRGNTKIGPVLEVSTSYLQGKYGVEIRIESVDKDNCTGMKRFILITHENYEEFISSTRRIRNSRKPSRMLIRNLKKHQLLLLCTAKL